MRTRTITIVAIVLVLAATAADLFYFRFHTYFQRTEVREAMPTPIAPGMPVSAPRTLVQGSFVGVDLVHKGSGTAKIIEQGGKRYLRLEDFQVTNGPDLYVYLAQSAAPGNALESFEKYVILGRLKGNVGDQNYEIPSLVQGYHTAVIWCQKFGVLFSYAVMR